MPRLVVAGFMHRAGPVSVALGRSNRSSGPSPIPPNTPTFLNPSNPTKNARTPGSALPYQEGLIIIIIRNVASFSLPVLFKNGCPQPSASYFNHTVGLH